MKKILFTGAALFMLSTASAQFYVNVTAGYGFALQGEKIGTNTTTGAGGETTAENVYGTIGPGVGIGLAPGWFFNEHIGAELGFSYFMGSEVDVQETMTPFGTATVTAYSNQLRMTPALVLRTGTEGLNGYMRAGVVIPLIGTTFTNIDDSGAAGPNTASTAEYETKGAPSFGFNGALGLSYGLNDRFSLFLEASNVNLRINAKERTLVAATSNGTDILSAMDPYDRETTYQDELDGSSNNAAYNPNYSENQAKDELRTRNNFSAMFINIGLSIYF